MGVQTQSALIAAVLLLALGINVAFQDRPVEHRHTFSAWIGSVFAYNLCWFLFALTHAELWRKLLLLAAVFSGQAVLRFFERRLATPMDVARTVVNIGSALCVILTISDDPHRSLATVPVAALALGSYGYSLWRLFLRYRAAETSVESVRLGYLVLGGALSMGFSALDLFPLMGIPFPSLGHLTTVFYLFLWSQVVQRSRLPDLKELLGRVLALVIVSFAVTSIYTGLVVWVGERLGLFFFNTFVASVVLILVVEPLRRAVDVWLGRLLFRETFEFEVELVRLRAELANVLTLGDLVERILGCLDASRRITHASVFILEDAGRGYFRASAVGPVEAERVDGVRARPFLELLRTEKVLALEMLEVRLSDTGPVPGSTERAGLEVACEQMGRLNAGLVFALASGDRLLGFLCLKDDRTREAFSSAEINLLAGLAAQATTVIENSELVERLQERDRLSVIGEMATGMAHEIRNPLGAIKAAAQLLSQVEVGEEDREFLDVIVEETDRLNGVLAQFLDYARPYKGSADEVAVNRVVERIATMLRAEERIEGVETQLQLTEGLPRVVGDGDRLTQVLLNLTRNACEAMPEGGILRLESRSCTDVAGRVMVEIRVSDTGPGVPPDLRANLFIPFFTTKKDGTGLGLAISQRIVQHHGGTLSLDSPSRGGATFIVRLPAEERRPDALTGEHRRRLAAETV